MPATSAGSGDRAMAVRPAGAPRAGSALGARGGLQVDARVAVARADGHQHQLAHPHAPTPLGRLEAPLGEHGQQPLGQLGVAAGQDLDQPRLHAAAGADDDVRADLAVDARRDGARAVGEDGGARDLAGDVDAARGHGVAQRGAQRRHGRLERSARTVRAAGGGEDEQRAGEGQAAHRAEGGAHGGG